jgi:hypothetical protein
MFEYQEDTLLKTLFTINNDFFPWRLPRTAADPPIREGVGIYCIPRPVES